MRLHKEKFLGAGVLEGQGHRRAAPEAADVESEARSRASIHGVSCWCPRVYNDTLIAVVSLYSYSVMGEYSSYSDAV